MGWNDIQTDTGSSSDKGKVNYLKMGTGNHLIRIIDDVPFSRWSHFIPAIGNHKGISIDCIGKATCPICAIIKADYDAKRKSKYSTRFTHAFNVIVKKGNDIELAIVDKGNTLINALKSVASVAGEPTGYYIQLVVGVDGKGDPTYTPIPTVPSPLTEAEIALSAEKVDLATLHVPLDVDTIKALLVGKSFEDIRKEKESNSSSESELVVDFTNTENGGN